MDYKWSGLEQKWIGSRKLNFLPTPTLHIGMKVKPFSCIKILAGCKCMDLCIGEWYNI